MHGIRFSSRVSRSGSREYCRRKDGTARSIRHGDLEIKRHQSHLGYTVRQRGPASGTKFPETLTSGTAEYEPHDREDGLQLSSLDDPHDRHDDYGDGDQNGDDSELLRP